ncbi:Hypp4379 [Branchiostoma lanceolatum]|uniref:Hypp4379 protein n=1 Tax=Branchiostoma lanceolatum TaxID=7740 RepID=A0A8K0A8M3_BRALA|nr:Hypp4379 [Branchiostoma lanceolatum]
MARTRMNRMRIKLRALFAALMLFSVLCSVMYYIYAAPGAGSPWSRSSNDDGASTSQRSQVTTVFTCDLSDPYFILSLQDL